MSSLLRLGNLFVLLTYAALSAIPLTPLLYGRALKQPGHIATMEVLAWLAVWAIFRRPSRFHWLLLPAFIVLPVELYLQAYYSQGISTHHLGIIAETTPGEALEFLGNRIWLLLGVMAVILAWWAACWKATLHDATLDFHGSRRAVALVFLVLLGSIWVYGREYGVKKPLTSASARVTSTAKSAASSSGRLPAWTQPLFDGASFAASWPFGYIAHAIDFWQERRYLAELADKSKQFKFGASQVETRDLPQTVVMVIGESSRFDRWGLNGYRRDTNPLLKKETNLVTFSDVITAVSATRLSVPVLVSRKPAIQSLKA